jgi:hypothetical protein
VLIGARLRNTSIGGSVIKQLRRKLSYANVVATLALFIALGGSSYAALVVTGRDVKNGSLTYRDMKRNTLGGTRINESRLGKVPRARNADRLNGVSENALRVRCPSGTAPVSDTCIEIQPRAPLAYGSAAIACESTDRVRSPGRRLPSHSELTTALGDYGIALSPGGELTNDIYPSSTATGRVDALIVTDEVGHVALVPDTFEGAKPFRCVTDPLN